METGASDWNDPGWPPHLWLALLPGARFVAARRWRHKPTTLTALRRVYLAVLPTPAYLLIILAFLSSGDHAEPSVSPSVVGLITGIAGALLLVGSVRTKGKEVPLAESVVVGAYRAVFFLRFALAEAAAMIGFVMFFLAGGYLWIYLIGFAFGTAGLLLMAPTKAAIDAWDSDRWPREGRRSLGALFTIDE
jgi:hypothetical protein